MNYLSGKLSVRLAALFEVILFVTGCISIASSRWKSVAVVLLSMVCLILPFIITHIFKVRNIVLPPSFEIVTLVFIFLAQYLGEINQFYQLFWWWDLLLHAIFGSYVVKIGLYSIKGIIRKDKGTTKQRFTLFVVIFAFSFSIALGTLWEVFEFIGDYLFKTNMVKGGLEDTLSDLLVKVVAASTTSIVYYVQIKNEKLEIT